MQISTIYTEAMIVNAIATHSIFNEDEFQTTNVQFLTIGHKLNFSEIFKSQYFQNERYNHNEIITNAANK